MQLAVANSIVIAVGPKTKQSLENFGIKVSYMPNRYSSVGVGEVLTRLNALGKKVIVPRSGASTPFLKNLLAKIGLDVKEIYLYDVAVIKEDTTSWKQFRELFSENKMDGIIFTSASSVRAFFEILSQYFDNETTLQSLEKTHVVAIGSFTADELEKFKVGNTISQVHTVPGALDTLKNLLSMDKKKF